jgi:hypothetical protein
VDNVGGAEQIQIFISKTLHKPQKVDFLEIRLEPINDC